jgi:hypothetical protein
MSNGDYVEQLTFLKMVDEPQPPALPQSELPIKRVWMRVREEPGVE